MPFPQSRPRVTARCAGHRHRPSMRLVEYVSGTGARYRCPACGREKWVEMGCDGFDVTGRATFDTSAPFAYLVQLIEGASK